MKRIKVHYQRVIAPNGAPLVISIFTNLQLQSLENPLKLCGAHKVRLDEVVVRASKVKEYLNLAILDPAKQYSVTPVLTNEALAKYEQKQLATSIDASIEGVTAADVAFLEGSGLEAALAKSVENRLSQCRH